MEARADYNIVDHYYYPDSDLETIQEESEDDRSSAYNSRRSSVSTSLRRDDPGSSMMNGTPSFYQIGVKSSLHPVKDAKPSKSNGYHSPSYVSYNGFDNFNGTDTNSSDSFSRQKIIYAKCLSKSPSPPHSTTRNEIKKEKELFPPPDMFQAATMGDITALNTFSPEELSNSVDENGNTPLHVVAAHGHLVCVKKLVSFFPPQMISLPNDDLITATGLAIKGNHLDCVKWLLRHSVARDELTVSQKASSIDGSSTRPPLAHVAARFNRNEILEWICNEMSRDDISIDVGDHSSNTPIHAAAQQGNLRCIQSLVARGASVTALNSDGDTPGQAAQKHGHDVTVGYLVVVETCASLAQQLVSLRHEAENLKSENDKLRKELDTKQAAHSPSNPTNRNEKNNNVVSSLLTRDKKDLVKESPRKTLLEQPPPPKLWSPSSTQVHTAEGGNIASMKGHTTASSGKLSKQKDDLQRKIDEALNGQGSDVDGEVKLKVSDVDGPTRKTGGDDHPTLLNFNDVNNEVKAITQDMNKAMERKPWEKLTMDEMLKMVRDIPYQPSPTISLCTEDSTMESVEVMRERMAAASRWFLVEKGIEKPKHVFASKAKHFEKTENRVHPNQKGQVRLDGRRDHVRSTNQKTLPRQHNTTAMQHAIQSHFQQAGDNSAETRQLNNNVKALKPQEQNEVDEKKLNKPVPTGTLKFMVSNAKESKKKSNSSRVMQSVRSLSVEKKETSNFIPVSPPITPPAANLTQRNNSYRRAVKIENNVDNEKGSGSKPPGSSESSGSDSTNASKLKESSASEKSDKHKKDPLQKRSTKEGGPSSMWTPTQYNARPMTTHSDVGKPNSNFPPKVSTNKPLNFPPRFNQWTVPRSNKTSSSIHSYSSFEDNDEKEMSEVSEVPELKVEIPSRQSSFLRRVQGRLK